MLLWGKKKSTVATGQLGETLAVRYLLDQGYAVVERNYRKRFGEVDIIAREQQTLVFIEVKRGIRSSTGLHLMRSMAGSKGN